MKISRLFALSIVGLGAATAVNAKAIQIPDVTTTGVKLGGFSDNYTFHIPKGGADLLFTWTFSSITNTGIELLNKKTGADIFSSGATSGSFTDLLSKGRYSFDLIGFGGSGGKYSISIAPAVPEATTWMMLLVGGGLVGVQLRRKHRALPRQTLTT